MNDDEKLLFLVRKIESVLTDDLVRDVGFQAAVMHGFNTALTDEERTFYVATSTRYHLAIERYRFKALALDYHKAMRNNVMKKISGILEDCSIEQKDVELRHGKPESLRRGIPVGLGSYLYLSGAAEENLLLYMSSKGGISATVKGDDEDTVETAIDENIYFNKSDASTELTERKDDELSLMEKIFTGYSLLALTIMFILVGFTSFANDAMIYWLAGLFPNYFK